MNSTEYPQEIYNLFRHKKPSLVNYEKISRTSEPLIKIPENIKKDLSKINDLKDSMVSEVTTKISKISAYSIFVNVMGLLLLFSMCYLGYQMAIDNKYEYQQSIIKNDIIVNNIKPYNFFA